MTEAKSEKASIGRTLPRGDQRDSRFKLGGYRAFVGRGFLVNRPSIRAS
jgi:hypothetical protein